MVEMELIAESKDIGIYADKGWEYSFFASPYHAHREFGAVDIYQGRDFGDVSLSPVAGMVYRIHKFKSPSLGKPLPEYLILIRSGDYLARIMHVEPSVREGDEIRVGDELGRFITNGYFFFWVDAGMHVEVRDLNDYLRAKGGYELSPKFKYDIKKQDVTELTGVVVNASKRNIAVELNRCNVVKIRDEYTLMDAATTIDYGGVLGKFSLGNEIYFNGIKIGKINKVGSYMSIFEMEELKVFVNDMEFGGISFMFGCNVARLLPKKYGDPLFKRGDKLRVKLKKQEK
ncbi:MAG: hypothetical protein U9Q22_06445 [Candidatus Altiarchaeota archaeon]|nr:hypothetical protein [Candidatus Altiarchaeota archaeon]